MYTSWLFILVLLKKHFIWTDSWLVVIAYEFEVILKAIVQFEFYYHKNNKNSYVSDRLNRQNNRPITQIQKWSLETARIAYSIIAFWMSYDK